jgi:hypothetical protein
MIAACGVLRRLQESVSVAQARCRRLLLHERGTVWFYGKHQARRSNDQKRDLKRVPQLHVMIE